MIKALFIALIVCGAFPFVFAIITNWMDGGSRNDPFGLGAMIAFFGAAIFAFVAFIVSTFVIVFTYVDKKDLPPPKPEKPKEKITAPAVPEEKPLSEFGKWLTTPLINPKDVNTLPKE